MIKASVWMAGWIATMLCAAAVAQQPGPAPEAQKSAASDIPYDPPKRGAPKGRVGGGTRGLDSRELSLAVIAPDHPGLASTPTPKLYWFLSKAISAPFEVSIVEDGVEQALVDKSIPAPKEAGVQVLDLAALGVTLKPEKEYRWFISLVSDPKARSGDIVASGKVIYEPLAGDRKARVDNSSGRARAVAFAAVGYWYDAFEAVRTLRLANPGDNLLRDMELQLIMQVGLNDVVRYLRGT
jgi:hypothetical protein